MQYSGKFLKVQNFSIDFQKELNACKCICHSSLVMKDLILTLKNFEIKNYSKIPVEWVARNNFSAR